MKLRSLLITALAFVTVGCGGNSRTEEVKIIAHRGYWNTEGSAKNSVSSLRNAIEFGAFGSEFDVHVTTDGVPVVFHDDRTSNGIVLREVTYAELISKAPKLASGETIPTLEEYLTAWGHSDTKLILEVKSAPTPELEAFYVEKILETMAKFGVADSEIEYIAFSWYVCEELLRKSPASAVSYLEGDKSPAEVAAAGLAGIDYHHSVYNKHPQWIDEAHEHGLIVNAWTVNSKGVMREMIEAGVDYITTDEPALLRKVMSEM